MDTGLADSFAKWSRVLQAWSPPQKKRRAVIVLDSKEEEELKKQKSLNRRAIYIPPPIIHDGPKDQWQKWSLYRATHQKLRRNPLPLLESIHLRKMLTTLQKDQSMPHHLQVSGQDEEEDDNVPLGTLMKSNQMRSIQPPIKAYDPVYTSKRAPQYPYYFHYSPHLFPLRFN
ncbi:hypothetical protein EDC96DRAFT_438615 [Choanephora cucurbitarum]|nr:hypothetical protein EDC96DRAFT_438615 [Choanephora cucurbitarum]